ncbi:uncharacterized protein PAN0_001c0352 [Moesziomyces antarcticus]|uniref:RNA polymerase II-associated protein 1 C-terminal domain-containing protein n=1 Tax=Pseudozyma antarctica TaxID=84753 RepID=A0A5C3FGR5_PSEA2|nr:uncharacterized protein PAN0_001c0352 [Moesziomyces antarcticus]GAK62155.1 conserved hypothetical protein [Moesziomyces antarcticus]SPO42691.1 uncharacterized protein PSANT_00374 [Moesziomyces antarcticus]
MASQDERELRKQQIRPRFLDLAEFDDDDMAAHPSSRRAALDSFSNWPPAATVVRRKPPTIGSSIKSETKGTKPAATDTLRKATVEDAEDHQRQGIATSQQSGSTQKTPITEQLRSQPDTKSVRFAPGPTAQAPEEAAQRAPPKVTLDLAGSIIGTIQERPVGERRTKASASTKSKPAVSRFVVRKRMDEELQKHEEQRKRQPHSAKQPEDQAPGTGFPVVSHRDQITPILPPASGSARASLNEDIASVEAPRQDDIATRSALSASSAAENAASADDEEWLDEAGNPMSAFRKSRLLRQGLRPPSVRSKRASAEPDSRDNTFCPDPTRDPGGGADIDAITAVLTDVSRENENKLRNMSASEVSDELRSLESMFGKDVLDALRNRKSNSAAKPVDKLAASGSTKPSQSASRTSNIPVGEMDSEGPLAIKRQYFPAEPEGPNPSIEWMMPQPSKTKQGPSDLRFDFSGKLISSDVESDKTYLSGLHHHGDDQDAPGYTFAELIHLTQSTVAAQRQLAVNVLGRISEHHPALGQAASAQAAVVTEYLNADSLLLRARTISISRFLLGDRHFTVRAAALRCLISAIRSLPSGISVPLGCEQELDFGSLFAPAAKLGLNQEETPAEASEVEVKIQGDWAHVMLESRLVSLFLDRTDSVITSRWEAEVALELLYRVASCSASHAGKVFEADPKRMCDWITHLGLNVGWPPVPADDQISVTGSGNQKALPSVFAVRLLHQGILADRKTAEAIALSGSIEHLLRFVVTPPWKFEADWTPNDGGDDATILVAYQIFDEVLQLFASLASYGFFASVVARTWQLWRECGSWAMEHLVNGQVGAVPAWCEEARDTAAQRIFEVLGAWTRCAMDPHELMTAHDITWTQVRDWIDVVHDASQQLDRTLADSRTTASKAPVLGALCQYVDHWLRCATPKEPKIVERCFDPCSKVLRFSQGPIQKQVLSVLRSFESAPSQAVALDEAEQACQACRRYANLSITCEEASRVVSKGEATAGAGLLDVSVNMVTEGLTLVSCQPLWQALESTESQADGRHTYKQAFSDFVAATLISDSSSKTSMSSELAAITRLDENHVQAVWQIVQRAATHYGGPAALEALRPFLLECIVGRNRVPETQASKENGRSYTPLSHVSSLFKARRYATDRGSAEIDERKEADDEQAGDDDDVDPITGGQLWICPAAGLPLRADWPLLAIDDLLHSGTTAVFNRPDNLDADWKPSELEMVRACLQLAVAMLQSQLRAHAPSASVTEELSVEAMASLSSLPSAEQVLLGVMKVFLLEKDQPDTFTDRSAAGQNQQKQAGALTGRDLFRDSEISKSLGGLLDVADQLVELREQLRGKVSMSTVTLDVWTARTYGGAMSSYQVFTDLLGLWDSVSFGDANFARVVMTIANAGSGIEGEHGVAVDFRRLVWNDYSDSLRSIPATPVAAWLLSWTEADVDMLENYCRYLATVAEMPAARSSMAWKIASHHVAAALRTLADAPQESVEQRRVQAILKTLIAAKGKKMLDELLTTSTNPESAGPEEESQRIFTQLIPDAPSE